MVARLGKCGDEAVVAEAKKRFHAHCNSTDAKLSGDLRKAVGVLVSVMTLTTGVEGILKFFDIFTILYSSGVRHCAQVRRQGGTRLAHQG